MPGVASVVSNANGSSEKIHLYYNTGNLNLGVQLKDGTADGADPNEIYVAGSGDQKGFIPNPSDLGATNFLGMKLVVGITQPVLSSTCTTYTTYNVSVVSPVYRPLTSTEVANTKVAITTDDKQAWIYYLSGTDVDGIKLKEYTLDNFAAASISGTSKILKGTHLAAYYNSENKYRYVIYQNKDDSHLYEYCPNTKDDKKLSSSSGAQSGTTIAVTYANKQAYLYYTDSDKNIMRLIKDSTLKWGGSSSVDNAGDAVDSSSQLTVTAFDTNNHLFYIADGGDASTFTHVRDPLDSS